MELKPYHGRNPAINEMMNELSKDLKELLDGIATVFESHEIAVAMLAVSLGHQVGVTSAAYAEHSEECDDCKNRNLSWRELFLKNCGAGFENGEAGYASWRAKDDTEGKAMADAMLAEILKGHKSGKLQPD